MNLLQLSNLTRKTSTKRRSLRGYTLVELMVTVAIVAVTAAIAVPLYTRQATKGKRTDVYALLTAARTAMEICFSKTQSYTDASCPDLSAGADRKSEHNLYVVRHATGSPTATTYTLEAVPTAGSAQGKDIECSVYTINHLGVKTGEDSENANNDKCWR